MKCLMILLLVGTPALAEDRAAARQAYIEGAKHYDLTEYAKALEAFKRAYWSYEDPIILYNIAQCHRALKQKTEAIDFYKSYLRKAPHTDNREAVVKMVSELEAAVEQERSLSAAPPEGQIEPKLAPSPAPAVVEPAVTRPLPVAVEKPRPVWKRGWVWGMIAGVVVTGVAVGVGVGLQPHPPRATDTPVSF